MARHYVLVFSLLVVLFWHAQFHSLYIRRRLHLVCTHNADMFIVSLDTVVSAYYWWWFSWWQIDSFGKTDLEIIISLNLFLIHITYLELITLLFIHYFFRQVPLKRCVTLTNINKIVFFTRLVFNFFFFLDLTRLNN